MSDCGPMDCSPPGSSVYGILQARIPEWVAISSSRGSSQLRDQTHISCVSCIGRWVLHHWDTSLVAQMWFTVTPRKILKNNISKPWACPFKWHRVMWNPLEPRIALWTCLRTAPVPQGRLYNPLFFFFNPSLDHLISYMFLFVCDF